jgi:hypothetical protein
MRDIAFAMTMATSVTPSSPDPTGASNSTEVLLRRRDRASEGAALPAARAPGAAVAAPAGADGVPRLLAAGLGGAALAVGAALAAGAAGAACAALAADAAGAGSFAPARTW